MAGLPAEAAWVDEQWYNSLLGNAAVIAVLAAFDLAVVPSGGARWFAIHAFANFLVCATCVRSLYAAAVDPVNAMDPSVHGDRTLFGDASPWPQIIINSVHVYHMLAFSKLSYADYFHHLLFVPTIGVAGQAFRWGAVGNINAFFMSGLPGGIDYAMLAWMKLGRLGKLTEKHVYSNLSVWMRCPGILWAVFLGSQGIITGKSEVPVAVLLPVLCCAFYNAMVYCKQAVANFAVHYMLDLLLQDEQLAELIKPRLARGKRGAHAKVEDGDLEVKSAKVRLWDLELPQRGS